MRKMLKIVLSILLVYEPLAYVFLVSRTFCRDVFSYSFCTSDMLGLRILLFLLLPIIVAALVLMWSGSFSKNTNKDSTRKENKKNIEQQKKKDKQKMVSFGESICNYWKKFTDISGRAQRSEYWYATCFYFGLLYLLNWGVNSALRVDYPECFGYYWLQGLEVSTFCSNLLSSKLIIGLIVSLFFVIAQTTLNVRRWHDLGLSGWLAVIPFVLFGFAMADESIGLVFIGFMLIQMVIFCFPSKLNNNHYGKVVTKKESPTNSHQEKETYGLQDWD